MVLKTDIYGIAYGCPKMNRVNNCPLLEIDQLSFKEKMDWIKELDEESQKIILRHHSICTKRKITK